MQNAATRLRFAAEPEFLLGAAATFLDPPRPVRERPEGAPGGILGHRGRGRPRELARTPPARWPRTPATIRGPIAAFCNDVGPFGRVLH